MFGQVAFCDCGDQGLCHGMIGGAARVYSINRVEPPLLAHQANLRFAHRFADAGDFDIEGVEGEEMGPRVLWREKAAQEPVLIGLCHKFLAMVAHRASCTAMKAAATLRFSASNTP